MNYPVIANQPDIFLAQIRKLSRLRLRGNTSSQSTYKSTGSVDAAHELVVSHLPFVVKVAFQYRHYAIPVHDLIQEGTIGLNESCKAI